MQTSLLPIFPLSIFILPKGRQKLRIFEEKYLNMVTHSLENTGFIIAHPSSNNIDKAVSPVSHWGTLVKIVDFNQGEDSVLLIDVEGHHLVSLQGFEYQEDGLLLGEYQTRQHWPINEAPHPPTPILVATLKEMFYQYQELQQMYPTPDFDNAQWVNARLLEVIPAPFIIKAHFIQPDSFSALTSFLITYIQGKN